MGFWKSLAGMFGGGSAAGAPSEAKVSPEEAFVQLYTARALEHPRVERVERIEGQPLALSVYTKGADEPHRVFLGNTFNERRDASPAEKLVAIDRLLSILDVGEGALDWQEARNLLVPQVRMAGFGGADAVRAGLFARPFVPFLHMLVGIDRGEIFSFVTQEQVGDWAQSEVDVVASSFAVLQSHVEAEPRAELASYDDRAGYGIWHVTRDDSYESSRLVLPGYLASFRGKVPGNPIAVVPHRSLLVISGDGDDAAIARLAKMAESEFNGSPRSISPAIYGLDADDHVVPLHLPADHPQHIAVERGHRLLAASCYADQKTMLEKSFEESGRDVFVASLLLFADKVTQRVQSWAAWSEGVETLLPEADLVALGADGAQPLFVPWNALREQAGELLELEPGHDPPRYRTLGFPSKPVLQRLAPPG